MYSKTDLIFVITTKVGYIPQLRMNGPIPTPVKIDVASCISILSSGFPLWQFDPVSKKVVQLTLTNVLNDNKFNETNVSVKEVKAERPVINEFVIQVATVKEDVVDTPAEETVVVEKEVDEIPAETEDVSDNTVEENEVVDTPVEEPIVVEDGTIVDEEVVSVVKETSAEVKTSHPKNKNKNKKKNK